MTRCSPCHSLKRHARHYLVLSAFVLVGNGCGDNERLSREQLMDPETCRDCHPKHVAEWQSSMHAYAADDPVFLAMNRRGQRETGGALGDFCVKCHAPMAVLEGATVDGTNLEDLPQYLKGVTCYFCHTVTAVEGTHNNPLVLGDDNIMRGGIDDPVDNEGHASKYSPLHDRNHPSSSGLCGSCHDIVTDFVHLERTFSEYKTSVFATAVLDQTCSNCHMAGTNDVVANADGVKVRKRHSHSFPGVDTAFGDWPGKSEQFSLIENELKNTVQSRVCYNPESNAIDVTLTNVGAGHMFPSGATVDRRAWLQLTASVGGRLVLESGVIADGDSVDSTEDPLLWRIYDRGLDDNEQHVPMFWEIRRLEGDLLPPSITLDPRDPAFDHSKTRSYSMGANGRPDRIEAVVRLRAIDVDLIDSLVESGDLQPRYREMIPTFVLEGSRILWTPQTAGSDLCVP